LDILVFYRPVFLGFLRDRVETSIIGAIFGLIRMILTITGDVTADLTSGDMGLAPLQAAIAFYPDEHSDTINALPVFACVAVIIADLHFDEFFLRVADVLSTSYYHHDIM
jgi:hypothetical protein